MLLSYNFYFLINFFRANLDFFVKSSKNKFSKNYAFVERMINSKNYTYMEPGISIREVKKILARIPTKKKCAVFGSSHVMEIRSDTISKNFKDICPSLINLAVAGSSGVATFKWCPKLCSMKKCIYKHGI